ncbi:hypothetical protein [Pseudomonas fluorescens]|uniref:hypothetical protein n=1 Tax=Pseudomonas fluorescens TaxID=294 RepID=UPI001240E195|nr:hypothetical protein [Pseudomonas fluorescens]VVO95141.1 hypothetical protein PS898_02522 [Pseudomonas fluorescens]
MTSAKKYIMWAVACVVGLVAFVALVVIGVLTRAASVSDVSPSGKYIIESVSASTLLTPRNTVYLRIKDRDHADQVYRSPIFSQDALDMRFREDEGAVGVVFIEMDKATKKYTLWISGTEEHWLNFFISNTPYEILEN